MTPRIPGTTEMTSLTANPNETHQEQVVSTEDPPRRGRPTNTHSRSIWPKEHGAYAELALPITTCLIAGKPSLAAILLVVSSCAFFMAHEPLLIVLGQRGTRAKREFGDKALKWFLFEAIVGAISGVGALYLKPDIFVYLIPAMIGAVMTAALVTFKKERTAWGETLVAGALTSIAVPIAMASALPTTFAIAQWVVWASSFGINTLVVKQVLDKSQRTILPLLVLVLAAIGLYSLGPVYCVSLLPAIVGAVALEVWQPTGKQVKKIGWFLVSTSLGTSIFLLVCQLFFFSTAV